jgi:hypothetical protein
MILEIYEPEAFLPNANREYTFGFEHSGLASIEVYEILDGFTEKVLVSPNDYTSEFKQDRIPVYAGGTIRFNRPHTTGTVTITVERNTRIVQLVDFPTGRPFRAKMIEYVLDYHTMIFQEIAKRKCDAVVTTPITQEMSFPPYGYLPAAAINAGLDKLYQIATEIDGSAEDCTDRPGET